MIEAFDGGRDTVVTAVSYKLAAGQEIEVLQTADAAGKAGTGTTTLSADNSYTGGGTIEAGTLDLGSSGSAGSGAITFSSMSGSASAQLVLEQGAQVTNGTFTNTLNDFGDKEALVRTTSPSRERRATPSKTAS